MLGEGAYGQVAKCELLGQNRVVAVKVVKSQPAYFLQASKEIKILKVVSVMFRT